MSLLSARNFILPMTERKQVITILLIAFFFGIYRLAGGGISIVSRRAPESRVETRSSLPSTYEAPEAAPPRAAAPKRAPKQPIAQSDDDILGDILGNGSSRRPSTQPERATDNKQLDDIEKTLGLR